MLERTLRGFNLTTDDGQIAPGDLMAGQQSREAGCRFRTACKQDKPRRSLVNAMNNVQFLREFGFGQTQGARVRGLAGLRGLTRGFVADDKLLVDVDDPGHRSIVPQSDS